VIVSDIRLPGYSGFDLLEALHDAQCDTPVILMTAFGDQETHDKARRLGAVAIFDKPFDADDLSTAVLWAFDPRPAYSLPGTQTWPRRRHQSRLGYGEGLRDRDREGADHGHLGSDESEAERQTELNVLCFPPSSQQARKIKRRLPLYADSRAAPSQKILEGLCDPPASKQIHLFSKRTDDDSMEPLS
jgi:CheY-like chemotaxis protein